MRRISIHLNGPGMTFMHRIGLAGLWMTLSAIEKDRKASAFLQNQGWSWKLNPQSVTMEWNGTGKPSFQHLLKESFMTSPGGLIWFRALGSPEDNIGSSAVLHESLLGTFLQHVKAKKVEPKRATGTLNYEIDGVPFILKYRKVTSYIHQKALDTLRDGMLPIAGWQYPGGTVRHSGWSATALSEPIERLLPLIYAPVGSLYFIVKSNGTGMRPQFAIVIPEVGDLEAYANVRPILQELGIEQLTVAGPKEAAFRVLATLQTRRMLDRLKLTSCRIVSFGTVPWSKQQKSRIGVFTVKVDDRHGLSVYAICQTHMSPTWVRLDSGDPFLSVPQTPELVADNLSKGRPWWSGFAGFVSDKDVGTHIFKYERMGIGAMVKNSTALPDSPEKIFVAACHEAWRRSAGSLGEDARRRGVSFTNLYEREFEKTRIAFAHCKDGSSFRQTITNFWARNGSLNALRDNWGYILPLLGSRWREGRDLALLALASYKGEQPDIVQDETSAEAAGEEE